MATPKLFKSFHHASSKQTFLDCTKYHNNPVAIAINECRVIKSGLSCTSYYPDIIVSIGTGFGPDLHQPVEETSRKHRFGEFVTRKSPGKVPKQRIASAAESQGVWNDYVDRLQPPAPLSAFVRLDTKLTEGLATPEAYWQMKPLETKIGEKMGDDMSIKRLASQLLAVLFYFEAQDPIAELAENHFVAQGTSPHDLPFLHFVTQLTYVGHLMCRLPNETPEIREIGKIIRDRGWEKPCFVMKEDRCEPQLFEMTPRILENMIKELRFKMPRIKIRLSKKHAVVQASLRINDEENSISGFPRSLVRNESRTASKFPPKVS